MKQYTKNYHGDIVIYDSCGLLSRVRKPVTYYSPVLDTTMMPWQIDLAYITLDIIEVVW